MALTLTASGLNVQKWDNDFFTEYVSESRFKPYMGTNEANMIQLKEDFSKGKGDNITFALVNRLTGAGITGSGELEGNEEALDSRSFRLYVDKIRNGVRIPEMEEFRSAIDLRNAARSTLKTWISEATRDAIIAALGSINGVAYGAASEAQKDAWLVDNADRVLFGAAKANNAANDHSAALLTVDATNDTLTPGALSLMKRIAKTANPKIRPINVKGDESWYVVWANPWAFRDLQNNATMTQANRDAMERGRDNPLFTGGDLLWDGLIIKEVEDIPSLGTVGASSAAVAPVYLTGAQALGIGWARRTTSKTKTFDYDDKFGVAIEEIRGIAKLTFGSGASDTADQKDNGVVTGYFAAVPDA
jgi:N4-gp56 family major capsid protein